MTPPHVAAAREALHGTRPGVDFDLRWFETLPTTMDVAAGAAALGDAYGLVVVAGTQTAGRGRRGRPWLSPPGSGLYLSMVIPPPASADAASLVTLAAGVGVWEALRDAGVAAAALKWPNDVLVERRKLAGILAEGHGLGTPRAAIVVGVGINLRPAAYPPEVASRATSVADAIGCDGDAGTLLAGVIGGVWSRTQALDHDRGGILQAWRAAAPSAVGATVEWDADGGVRRGTTAGIDDTGALRVQTPSGFDRLVAGEVRWI